MDIKEKKLAQAMLKAFELLNKHDLNDWDIDINNKVTAIGETYHGTKTIKFSERFTMVATKEQFEGVALHEIAHALLPAGSNHGSDFIRKCTEISPTTKYVGRTTEPMFISRYKIVCPECGKKSLYNTKKKGYCIPCKNNGKEVFIETEKNDVEVTVW